jgi:2,4-dienoyl-CoA reductase-like NADH-dependent reductase (Old Yellow Enzyme family)/thioredoxin reductase
MSHPFQLICDNIKCKVSLTHVAADIAAHGAVPAAELNHAGRNSNIMFQREGFIYGPADGEFDGMEVREMPEAIIEETISAYARAAAFIKQFGFGMITLHGGHGWLIHQFMSERDNTRKDGWGGSFENRMRFPQALIDAVRKEVGRAYPIEIRISAAEHLPGGYEIDEGVRIARALDGRVDLIHVSVGHHEIDEAAFRTHPSMFAKDACNLEFAAEIKKNVKTPVALVGALTDVDQMEEIVASGQADILELGRQTLADPDLPLKARMGKTDEINRCLRCFNCFSNSKVNGIFYCATNPIIGHELESKFDAPPRFQKKILIAGGGIGGMQAALTAAARGHTVILCEKGPKTGGTLLCETNIPFKDKLKEYLERQALRLSRSTVEVRLNTEVTPEYARQAAPDVIIAALGARPVKPPIRGIDNKNVFGAEEIYHDPEKAGKRLIIMGAGLVGLELGLYLAMSGRDVTIVEMASSYLAGPPSGAGASTKMNGLFGVNHGEQIDQGTVLYLQMKDRDDIRAFVSTKAVEATDTGLIVEDASGLREIEADTIIYAVGQKPLREEAWALSDCAPEFYPIGDCVVPRSIFAATSAAYQTACDIGRY